MSRGDIDLVEGTKVLESAFPMQGVTIQKPGGPSGAYKIVRPNGEVIGSAFNLKTALQQACQPVLEKAKAEAMERAREREREFVLFMSFLRERFNDEFVAYREAHEGRAEAAPEPAAPRIVAP